MIVGSGIRMIWEVRSIKYHKWFKWFSGRTEYFCPNDGLVDDMNRIQMSSRKSTNMYESTANVCCYDIYTAAVSCRSSACVALAFWEHFIDYINRSAVSIVFFQFRWCYAVVCHIHLSPGLTNGLWRRQAEVRVRSAMLSPVLLQPFMYIVITS